MPYDLSIPLHAFIIRRCGQPPSGSEQCAQLDWIAKRREAVLNFLRWKGCCGVVRSRDEGNGTCWECHGEVREHYLRRLSVEAFAGDCESDREYEKRFEAFCGFCDICPRFLAERLVEKMATMIQVDEKINTAREMVATASGELGRTIAIANAIKAIGEAIEPQMDAIMALQNSSLGFLTDRAKDGYDRATVKSVMIVGLLNGFSMVGNEINVISGRMYGAQAGYKRKLESFPGLSNLNEHLSVPAMGSEKTALVAGFIECKIDGRSVRREFLKRDDMDLRIAVRVNDGMGPDAVLGKAKRKAYKAFFEQLSGMRIDDDLEDDTPAAADANTIDSQAAPSQQVANLTAPKGASGNLNDEGEPLKKHELNWLEASQAALDKAENLHDVNAVIEDTRNKKPLMSGRVEALAVEARKRFGAGAPARQAVNA